MKIDITKDMRFEITNRDIKLYFICVLVIVLSFVSLRSDPILTIIAVLVETFVFIWLNTKYYPGGTKSYDEIIESNKR